MSKTKVISQLILNNLILHDDADYEGLRKNTFQLLVEEGYDSELASDISGRVKQIYLMADEANNHHRNGDEIQEGILYNTMKKSANDINDRMGHRRYSRIEIDWWKSWRHRKYSKTGFLLFRYNLLMMGIKHPIAVLENTYYLLMAGKCHNEKDWNKALLFIEKMWENISSYSDKLPLIF